MKNQLQRFTNYAMTLGSLLLFWGCKTSAQKLTVSPIYAQHTRIEGETESNRPYQRSGYEEITPRYSPAITLLDKKKNSLKLRIQGNISSAGLRIAKIKKIRFEEEMNGDILLLKYTAEIHKIPGKEANLIRGYNYVKEIDYNLPQGFKSIKVALYEERRSNAVVEQPKLVFEDVFNIVETD